jgi:hypothetical protein
MVGKVIVTVCGMVGTCGESLGIVFAKNGSYRLVQSSYARCRLGSQFLCARIFNRKYSGHHVDDWLWCVE